jgi:hypothetical protein
VGGFAEGSGMGAAELTGRGEAGRHGDAEHRRGRLAQELARPLEPHRPVLLVDAVAEMAVEQALELAHRNACNLCHGTVR